MATNSPANIPTGNLGTILQGQGIGTANAFSTATYPSIAGTSGKVLISDGTNIVSSTPTFPNASATLNKIIKSDGTNWIASTETYAAPGSSGNVLTSNGTNWTSAAPATSGTVTSVSGTANQVAVANGTTTPVISLIGPYTPATYTAHGVLIGEGTSSIVALAAGSAGQVLQSGGASADPAYSTATYPATAGTSGNVLTSDGTNWTSATPSSGGGLLSVTVSITNAQLKNLTAASVQILAAPGSGKVIVPVQTVIKLIYGGSNAFTSAGATRLTYGTTPATSLVFQVTAVNNTAFWQATANEYCIGNTLTSLGGSASNIDATVAENAALGFSGTSFTGNAANNNTATLQVLYYVVTLT